LEKKHNLKLADFDLVEVNEAFAAQVLACDRELHFDRDKLNVNGGAIALGHPIGCTGTRITVTLLHEMLKRKSKRGLATLCVSGGMGLALALELSKSHVGRTPLSAAVAVVVDVALAPRFARQVLVSDKSNHEKQPQQHSGGQECPPHTYISSVS